MESLALYEEEIESQSDLVLPDDEESLLSHCKDLGQKARTKEEVFKQTVNTTIEQACEIGRIAFEAQESIKRLPTKEEKAKLLKVSKKKLDYRKPTFEQWIETYTGIGKDTIYSMIRLYEKVKDNPDYEMPEDTDWRKALGFFSEKQKLLKSQELTEDGNEDGNEDDGSDGADSSHEKFESERKAFNKMYEKIDKIYAQFLDTSENEEFKNIVARLKNSLTDNISALNLPDD